jgi:hypothetical protein
MFKQYLRSLSILAGVAAVTGFATPSFAQQAGEYTGMSADGNPISLQVTGSSGNFAIGNGSVGFLAKCRRTGNQVNEGWGFYLAQPIVNHKAGFTSGDDYYYIAGTVAWESKTAAHETIESWTATFTAKTPRPPTGSQFCVSPKQKFSLTYQGPAKKNPVAPGTATAFENPANGTSQFGGQH